MVEVGSSLAIVVGALVLLRVGLQVAGVGRRAPGDARSAWWTPAPSGRAGAYT